MKDHNEESKDKDIGHGHKLMDTKGRKAGGTDRRGKCGLTDGVSPGWAKVEWKKGNISV